MKKINWTYIVIVTISIFLLIFILFYYISSNALLSNCIVSKVIDGDTIWCTFPDRSTKIRLLAIDTPEITSGRRDCYGKEAKDWLSFRILNKKIKLEYDKEKPTYGNYGRLLAYIWLGDQNINFEMIKLGYARALTKYPIHKYPIKKIVELELEAIKNNVGLWKDCY